MISIIVPYHNSADYLEACINSLLTQTYRDWELILINDHSSDESQLICERFAEADKRIVSLHNDGKGVSAARNFGIHNARGEKIVFVDSDDWLFSDALEILEKAICGSDLVSASYCKMENVDALEKKMYLLMDAYMSKSEFIEKLFNSNGTYQGFCWGKIFKTEIIRSNSISFDTSLAYNEDRLFVLEYALCVDKIRTVNRVIYGYRQHGGSAMAKAEANDHALGKKIENEIQSAKKINRLLAGNFPKGQMWLEFNLLKKLYAYKRRISKPISNEMNEEICRLENSLKKADNLDGISKVKLLWNKMRAFG